jgi:hypothetical protein
MEKDMEEGNFSIKMAVAMMVSGNKTKCKVMVNYFINQINLLTKDIG